MGDIDVTGFGKLWVASKADAPLLVVFGGVDVTLSDIDGVKRKKDENKTVSADVYMWNYMNGLKSRYHIFVSIRPRHLKGKDAYKALMDAIPSTVAPSGQILYLFSGGWSPGMMILRDPDLAKKFSSIFLVDIWMGNGDDDNRVSPTFYTRFVNTNADRVTYVHTTFGASNDQAMNTLVKKLGPQKAIEVDGQAGEGTMHIHMRTNEVAVGMLP